jgi:transcription elongation factor Elf1
MAVTRLIELKRDAPPGELDRYLFAMQDNPDTDGSEHSLPGTRPTAGPDVLTPAHNRSAETAEGIDGTASSEGAEYSAVSRESADRTTPAFVCPGCGHEFAVADDAMPANGLLSCPSCGGEFFAAAEMSEQDRAELERMEADRREREDRLVDIHENKVLLERRSLARVRTYAIVALVLLVVISIQLAGRSWLVYERYGVFPMKFQAFVVVSVLCWPLAWLCVRKIRAINAELRKPLLQDPETPPDFSTLSDGSQLVDQDIRNLEKLTGR